MTVEIVLKKQYPTIQDAITELDQAEALGFTLQTINVIAGGTP